jgi:L-seryl-tRNA(Ser) seleniumtransferase
MRMRPGGRRGYDACVARSKSLRQIPSVDRILREIEAIDLPRPALLALIRRELSILRNARPPAPGTQDIITRIRVAIDDLRRARLQPVINGTGIIIHTNFGRAPMGAAVASNLAHIASTYNNLEFDLTSGERGGRGAYLEHNLAVLCGADAATVVNNCAAALVLVLRQFASREPRREVIISRGELVQIGGGFRIPEILEASGAILREVGTTNKTALSDYSRAIGKKTAMILKVHRSNFFMDGFVDSPDTRAIATLARKARIPFVDDLGSGAVIPMESMLHSAEREPAPAKLLGQGVDLITFSGDKLLGGPQAGIIAGRARLVAKLKKDPLFRALRCDKLILSALQSTIDLHLAGMSDEIPIIRMMRADVDSLHRRAEQIEIALRDAHIAVKIGAGKSQVGGGSMPRTILPSITLDLRPRSMSLSGFAGALRKGVPPVIGYLSGGDFRIDLRTVFESQDAQLIDAIRTLC